MQLKSRTCFRNSAYAATTKLDLTKLSDVLKTAKSFNIFTNHGFATQLLLIPSNGSLHTKQG